MAKKQEGWSLKAATRRLTNWVKQRDRTLARTMLEATLDSDESLPFEVAIDLAPIAAEVSAEGAAAVLSGDASGWQSLYRGWRYGALSTWLHIAWFDHACQVTGGAWIRGKTKASPRTWIDLNSASLRLCESIGYGDDRFSDWLSGRLLTHLESNDPTWSPESWNYGPRNSHLEAFVAALAARARGQTLRPAAEIPFSLGPYQSIFDAWDDPPRLALAITSACDAHCRYSRGDDDPFASIPYEVYPVEIIAVRELRSSMGLEMPAIAHPLLDDNPLYHPPNQIGPMLEDDLFDRAVKVAQRTLGAASPPLQQQV